MFIIAIFAALIILPLAAGVLRAFRSPKSLEDRHIELSAKQLSDETGISYGRCYDYVTTQHNS